MWILPVTSRTMLSISATSTPSTFWPTMPTSPISQSQCYSRSTNSTKATLFQRSKRSSSKNLSTMVVSMLLLTMMNLCFRMGLSMRITSLWLTKWGTSLYIWGGLGRPYLRKNVFLFKILSCSTISYTTSWSWSTKNQRVKAASWWIGILCICSTISM